MLVQTISWSMHKQSPPARAVAHHVLVMVGSYTLERPPQVLRQRRLQQR